MKRPDLWGVAVLLCGSPCGWANEVVWTASGAVTSVAGAGLAELATQDDPVTIELRYNDDAVREPLAISEFPGAWAHYEYRVEVDLDLRVTIGDSTWRGTLATGTAGRPYTIEVQDFAVGPGTVDFFKVSVGAEDGGSFPSFPGATVGAKTLLDLRFASAESEEPDGPDYLGSTMLCCVRQSISRIASATGTITDGVSAAIAYTIDPGMIVTQLLGVQAIELKEVLYDTEFDEVTLRWTAVPGRIYVIEYYDEFLCWREVISLVADETEESEFFFPAGPGIATSQIYRVVEYE